MSVGVNVGVNVGLNHSIDTIETVIIEDILRGPTLNAFKLSLLIGKTKER